jgi:hypothetical protein
MSRDLPDRITVLDAIREAGQSLGRPPSRSEFKAHSGMTEYQVLQHFASWREAVKAAGLEPDSTNVRLSDEELLRDWGALVRRDREIPTRHHYRRHGKYSPGVFERHFGPWSAVPSHFRRLAEGNPEWADVLALLPIQSAAPPQVVYRRDGPSPATPVSPVPSSDPRPSHSALPDRPTYGNPIDFRGLRHVPVNEQGVVFLFGMVARELGYMVEAVQAGFPDCEAKRQVAAGKWQRVRIEFEFESRNFRDHVHPPSGCDLIVCWRHTWSDCPANLEVVELESVLQNLAKSDE